MNTTKKLLGDLLAVNVDMLTQLISMEKKLAGVGPQRECSRCGRVQPIGTLAADMHLAYGAKLHLCPDCEQELRQQTAVEENVLDA